MGLAGHDNACTSPAYVVMQTVLKHSSKSSCVILRDIAKQQEVCQSNDSDELFTSIAAICKDEDAQVCFSSEVSQHSIPCAHFTDYFYAGCHLLTSAGLVVPMYPMLTCFWNVGKHSWHVLTSEYTALTFLFAHAADDQGKASQPASRLGQQLCLPLRQKAQLRQHSVWAQSQQPT